MSQAGQGVQIGRQAAAAAKTTKVKKETEAASEAATGAATGAATAAASEAATEGVRRGWEQRLEAVGDAALRACGRPHGGGQRGRARTDEIRRASRQRSVRTTQILKAALLELSRRSS